MTTPRRRHNRQSRHLNYEALESRNLLAVALFQNPIDAWDVNGDGIRSPLDPLIVINYLNANGVSGINLEQGALPDHYVDVNGDGFVTAVDALMGINALTAASQQPLAEPEEAGEVPDFITDAILQATANAEHAPAGNIFEIAAHTYREIAHSSLEVHQAINDQIVQTSTDSGPLLRELLETFNTEYRHATQRFIEHRDVTQFVQDIQELNSEAQHITREIISDNSQQILDLANVRRDVLRNQADQIAQVAQSVTQNVLHNIRHGLPPHHAQSTAQSSIHAALDATSAAIQEFEQRLDEWHLSRSLWIAEISSWISNLGSHA